MSDTTPDTIPAEDINGILNSLELQEWISVFQKQKITKDVLQMLSEEMITELIPVIGPRAIFLSYWRKTFKKKLSLSVNSNEVSKAKKKKNDEPDSLTDESSSMYSDTYSDSSSGFQLRTVKDILQECVLGQRIIKAYARDKQLSEKTRNKICDMVITDFENRFGRLNNETAEKIANLIVADFPTEVSSTYYVPPIKKKDSVLKKSIPARGKILNLWRNRTLAIKKFESSVKTIQSTECDSDVNDLEDNPEVQESIQWLYNNQMPWELVLQHWHKTFNIRKENIEKSKENTLLDSFTRWPILKHPHGHELIIDDFKHMSLSEEKITIDKWNTFFHHITSCVKPSQKDDQLNLQMETLKDTNINEDSKVALQIMILPHLLPPKKMTRCKNKFWKPSIWNAKDSIIKHAVIPGDVTKLREDYIKKCKELKLTIQPYMIVVGPTLHEINTSYVCIDDVLYNTSSTLEAFDVCFKTFHVLQLQYPTASEHLWFIIQKCLYNFVTKWDIIIPSTEHIIKILHEKNQSCASTTDSTE